MTGIKAPYWMIPLFVYILPALLIISSVLGPGYYIVLDMQFGPSSFADFQFYDFYGYSPSSYGAYFPLRMVMAALASLLGVEGVEKLLLFTILVICGISMHFSLPASHGNSRYVAGLFYMLNSFVFIRFIAGHWSLLLSYALWPISLLYFREFLERPNEPGRLAKVTLLTSVAAVSSHGVAILLICYGVLFLASAKKRMNIETIKPALKLAAAVLVMNLYWIAPTILLFGETYSPASSQSYLADFAPSPGGMPLPFAMASLHGFWRSGYALTKDAFDFWYVPFIAIILFSIFGLITLLKSDRPFALALLFMWIVFLLLALADSGPLSFMFTLLGSDFPLYFLFRDSQKFVGVLALVYSLLASYGLSEARKRFPARGGALLLSLALIAVLIHDFGIFTLFGQARPTQYPAEWYEAEKIMAADPSGGNLLILPGYLYSWQPWVNASQKTVGSPASQFFSRPVITDRSVLTPNVHDDVVDPWGDYIDYLLKKRQHINGTAELLLPLGARYAMVMKNYPNSDEFLWLFKRRGGVKDIELVYESKTFYLFRNNLTTGPFFSTDHPGNGSYADVLAIAGKGILSPNVSYYEKTPASYYISNATGRYLVLALPYSKYLYFGSVGPSPWNGLATAFVFSGPGMLGNSLFPVTLFLFLLAWFLAITVLLDLRPGAAALLSVPFALLYFALVEGLIGPSGAGAILLVSFASAFFVSKTGFLETGKTFLNLK
jgi:hypothetical protein